MPENLDEDGTIEEELEPLLGVVMPEIRDEPWEIEINDEDLRPLEDIDKEMAAYFDDTWDD